MSGHPTRSTAVQEARPIPVTEHQRHQSFKWYEAAMGPERAAIMMELLPPVGWGEIATKTDLMVLEGRLRGEIAELRGEVRGETAGLRGEMAELRGEMAELRGEMSELSGELQDEMGKLRSEMGQLSLAQANGLRSLFLAMVATNATTVGLVFAAVRFGST